MLRLKCDVTRHCECYIRRDKRSLSKMTIKFVLLVNKQGQTRLAKYTDQALSVEERRALEGEIVRKCLARSEKQVKQLELFFPLPCLLASKINMLEGMNSTTLARL